MRDTERPERPEIRWSFVEIGVLSCIGQNGWTVEQDDPATVLSSIENGIRVLISIMHLVCVFTDY
jgi:hypothetical protein